MILNCGVLIQWRPRFRTESVCLASSSATAEQLRQQLDSLHKEADYTRTKANNARLRLIRLSEAVDKLRRQAAISIQGGKENDARGMLFQKKKVMQAMEKLKTRIELFDELSSKLNEAISMKESMLVGNMALDLDVAEPEPPSHVRIVSPTDENRNYTDDNDPEFEDDQNLQGYAESQVNIQGENELNNHNEFSCENESSIADSVKSRKEISTYEDFIQHLDLQLNEIEQELKTFLRFSNFLLDSKEKPEYSKVQHATEVLEDIRHARNKIASVKQSGQDSDEISS